MIRAVVWNEFVHERENASSAASTPTASTPPSPRASTPTRASTPRTATLDEPENGLPLDRLKDTDVLLWWGHKAHARSTTPPSTASPSGSTRGWG